MSDNTIYSDFVMAGATDNFFRWYTGWEMPAWADGNVEAPTGWFAVCTVDSADIAQHYFESGDYSVTSYFKRPMLGAYYLVQIDSLGFVYTVSYEGLDGQRPIWDQRRRALADFNRLRRLYIQWEDAVEAPHIEDDDWQAEHARYRQEQADA